MNFNAITKEELQNRTRDSKRIYFDFNFIPSKFITHEPKIHDITPEMVHQFLNRYNDHNRDFSNMVWLTESKKKSVLDSVNAMKSFFRNKGYEYGKKEVIDYYNEHYLEQGSEEVITIKDIVDRKHDMCKVSNRFLAFY